MKRLSDTSSKFLPPPVPDCRAVVAAACLVAISSAMTGNSHAGGNPAAPLHTWTQSASVGAHSPARLSPGSAATHGNVSIEITSFKLETLLDPTIFGDWDHGGNGLLRETAQP